MRLGREKTLLETYLDNRENELKIAGCHMLETMFGIKVAGAISSA